ncbi:MAG TPA: ATP-binding protein [Pseudonocardiaceae bacterium]|jgi:signal transduction histidine kinase
MTRTASTDVLLTLSLHDEPDLFLLRQRGREVAAAVGLETQDQIRVATALSDLGRIVLTGRAVVSATFGVTRQAPVTLQIELEWWGQPPSTSQPGWRAAARLLDDVDNANRDGRQVVTLDKRLPTAHPLLPSQADQLRAELAGLARGSALDELRAQNQELLTTLEALERKQRALVRVNDELTETNRGVLALYGELTAELDRTNQGVVALYAELEDKTEELARASEAKTRFWSNVSHELRTPINSIVGLTRLLLGAGAESLSDDQCRQVTLVNEAGEAMLILVGQLLDVAKAESGRLDVRPTSVDLRLLFAALTDTLRPTTPTTDVELRLEEPPPPARLVTDESMLVHILRNVLANGLAFTEHGEVRLAAAPDPDRDRWRFTVTDTGIGIPEAQQDRVFEEFHQVPNHLQKHRQGTGLGLPYARKLAELLGGSLTLSSTPGEGTEVVLDVPAVLATSTMVDTALIVIDDDTLRTRLRHLTTPLAHTVTEAADCADALAACATGRPDVIILGLDAVTGNSQDCLAELRRDDALAGVPVMVLTSSDGDVGDADGEHDSVLLHRSRLSTDVVREGLRRAIHPIEKR